MANGFVVDVLTYPVGANLRINGVRIFRGPNPLSLREVPIGLSAKKIFLDLALVPRILRMIRSGHYDVVHAVEEAAFIAGLSARRIGVPLVYDMQSSLAQSLEPHTFFRLPVLKGLVHWAERWLLHNASMVLCSTGLAKYVREINPAADCFEWVFPALCPVESLSARDALNLELKLKEDDRVVLYTGSFADYQGLEGLVASIPLVLSRAPNVRFLFIGGDHQEATVLFSGREDLLLGRNVVYLGRQPRERIRSYMAAADVLVSPRRDVGNVPLKIFDYMAAGKPIVASDTSSHRAVINDTQALFVEDSAESWADAICELISVPELGRRLAKNAADWARLNATEATFHAFVGRAYARLNEQTLRDQAAEIVSAASPPTDASVSHR